MNVSERFTMLKNSLFIKTVCGVTIYSFILASIPQNAKAWGLPPESFNRMYAMAHNGEVEGLRASMYRGLNIDATNSNGYTGLCVAAERRDIRAYNAFRAAGANPHHPCTQYIDNYNEFVRNSNAVPMTANSREAYSALGKEEYKVSPWVWWTGGALLVGGIVAAIALGGGGGGGGSSSSKTPDPQEDYNSLGATAAQNGTVDKNATAAAMQNTTYQEHSNGKQNIYSVFFNNNVLQNSDYLDVVLKAYNNGSYVNTAGTVMEIGNGTIGMDALKNSLVENYGYINLKQVQNASIAMVASEGSTAVNYGKSAVGNGIDIFFAGKNSKETVIGMYADTKSTIINNGDILGTATLADSTTAIIGSLIGMEAMIINTGQNLNQDTINITNAGSISLNAGTGSASNVAVELVGMGSYLDYGFLNGSKNINRAEKVNLVNNGDILLRYAGSYTTSAETDLRDGLGGIVGMRADANGSANNNGTITINLDDNGTSEGVNVSAGMQAVHGGTITNSGSIAITTPETNNRINYGMLSVEGSGQVSSLYTRPQPSLTNGSNINITASNSYGMATFNSGTLANSGNITLGIPTNTKYKNNIAMYAAGTVTPYAKLVNTNTINIYSYSSVAMQNDFGGGTEMVNDGTINVYDNARSTKIFAGAYSNAINKGTINYNARPYYDNNPESTTDYTATTAPTDGSEPFTNYVPTIGIGVLDTAANSTSSTTEQIYNGDEMGSTAAINIENASFVSAMQVNTAEGQGLNYGTITLKNKTGSTNMTNAIGMFLSSTTDEKAQIVNYGTIVTNSEYAAAMASASEKGSSVINASGAEITVDYKHSLGMYASSASKVHNRGVIQMNGDESAAIYLGGNSQEVSNDSGANIQIGFNDKQISTGYGIFSNTNSTSVITNKGTIDVYTQNDAASNQGGAIWLEGNAKADNQGIINLYNNNAYGMYAGVDTPVTAKLTNSGTINVGQATTPVKNSYAIYTDGTATITNATNGIINLYNDATASERGYAIYSTGEATIENNGTINLHNANSAAIYAGGGSVNNNATLNIRNDNSYGLEASGSANVTNSGTINVGQEASETAVEIDVNDSYAMVSTADATGTLANSGTINVYSADDSYGILARGTTIVDNSGNITAYKTLNADSEVNSVTAVLVNGNVDGNNTVNNTGTITAIGKDSYAIRGTGSTLTVNNGSVEDTNAEIILGSENEELSGGAAISAAIAGTINNYGKIKIYNSNASAISVQSGGDITNYKSIETNGAENDTGISYGGSGKVVNRGTITMGTASATVIATGNYGINATDGSVENSGTITMNTIGSAIKANSGVKVTNTATGGIINLNRSGSHGIYSNGAATIENAGVININGENSWGIWVDDASSNSAQIINKGTINVATTADGSMGIYAISPSKIENSVDGSIYANGANSFGIYVVVKDETQTVDIVNNGVIKADGEGSYAIYVQKEYIQGTEPKTEGETTKTVYSGDNTTVTANGAAPIAIKAQTPDGGITDWHEPGTEVPTQNSPASVMSFVAMAPNTTANVRLINNGVISTNSAVDFGDGSTTSGQNVLAAGGQYVAESFRGTVHVDASNVSDGFAETYVNEDAFVGEDDGIEVVSDSYMFNASTLQNNKGNTNVVMSLNSFEDIADNDNTASFLTTNYAAGQGANVFQTLKAAATQKQFDVALNRSLGLNVMPNFVKQNLDTERTLNAAINDDVITASDEKTRARFKAMYFNNKANGQHQLSGYDYKTTALFGFSDTQLTDLYSRVGLGLAVARSYGKFNDGSKRYDNMAEVFAPISYQRANTVAMFKPKGGMARGHYRRLGADKRYKGNNRDYYYGADTLVNHTFDAGVAKIIPSIGVNVTGMYVDSIHESNGGMKIKAKNIVSTQSMLGLDIAKTFAIADDQNLYLSMGGKYYHEFGQKYRTKATVDDMIGGYDIVDERQVRDFGILSLKTAYQYNQFSVGAEAHAPIEHNRELYYLFNFGYQF